MDNDTVSTPRRMLNFNEIVDSWSPEDIRRGRDEKIGTAKVVVRSLQNNTRKLRGGDIIFNKEAHMILGLAWNMWGKQFAVTVGHAFTDNGFVKGDTVYAYDSDEEVLISHSSRKYAHKIIRVGVVVSIDDDTDSAIVEIDPCIRIDPLVIALSGNDSQLCKIVLPTPGDKPKQLAHGEKSVMYGAFSRGMIGCRVKIDDNAKPGKNVKFATQSFEAGPDGCINPPYGATKLTFLGDCGAWYLDEYNIPRCMHTAIKEITCPETNSTVWTSRAVNVQDVADVHPYYFGQLPTKRGHSLRSNKQSSPAVVKLTTISSPKVSRYPEIYFPLSEKIESTIRKQPCPNTDERLPIILFPDDDEPIGSNDVGGFKEEEKKQED